MTPASLLRLVRSLLGAAFPLGCALAARGDDAPDSTAEIDHAGIIRSWDDQSLARGRKLYTEVCITCHGSPTQAGSLPTSRPFWKEPFRNGPTPSVSTRPSARGSVRCRRGPS